jgi:hypothetical protein
MSIRTFVLVTVILVLINNSNISAKINIDVQSHTDSLEIVVNKLKLKLLLNEDQYTKIKALLSEYDFRAVTENNKEVKLKLVNDKVEQLLSRKQKVKFEILKPKWLNELFENIEEKKSITD